MHGGAGGCGCIHMVIAQWLEHSMMAQTSDLAGVNSQRLSIQFYIPYSIFSPCVVITPYLLLYHNNHYFTIQLGQLLQILTLQCVLTINSHKITQYYCLISTQINVNDLLNNNKDTEVSYVSLTVSSEGEDKISQNFSISPTTKISTLNASFHYKCSTNNSSVRIHMTVFDKCGQQSDLVTQQCMS